ncbi:MAG: indolepyruvate oxidoreductase subunit beta [Deltaproteobacteria bacterium]|nr:MAG: indolepyruvate oxidoreductase subunit beta [Deltaproteobacteria bacterium]RLB00798.1 MAG: indolepyruvate oxidoreductase subunit beta [Deltaproteobacteria bacterium]
MGKDVTNILVCGVGGQGVILASDVMADTFLEAGYDVKKSEVHGMAQRGGAVVSHVRYGQKVYSPLIRMGEVDYLFSTEKLEVLRWMEYCTPSTVVITDTVQINPPAVNLGEMEYPTDIDDFLKGNFEKVYTVDATEIAKELGNARAANVVLLGVLSKLLGIEEALWKKCLLERLPKKLHELNLQAFEKGRLAV